MSALTGCVCCVLVVLWTVSNTVQGQTCDCSKPGVCNPPRLCYPGSQQCNRENVALGRPTNMSSGNTPPCQTVDGNITVFTGGDCSYAESTGGDYSAWWYVDLGQNYIITYITIYRRPAWWSRMSDLQVKVDGQLCYTFPSHSEIEKQYNLPFAVNIQCVPPLTGRVVSLQKVNTDLNDKYTTHLINVCEVQVWGCAPGYYGADCESCGHCAGDVTCNIVTGVCPSGCLAGWQGTQCLQPCNNGTYGDQCMKMCGQCRYNYCDKTFGRCAQDVCQDGWQPFYCQTCAGGYYGDSCTACGNCQDGSKCDSTTGLCPSRCKAGWLGVRCLQPCGDGTYGPGCAIECGQCAGDSTCNKTHGDCPAGCHEGWNGTRCDLNVGADAPKEEILPLIIGPAAGGFVLVLIVVIIIVVIVRRRRRSPRSNKVLNNTEDACTDITTVAEQETELNGSPLSFAPIQAATPLTSVQKSETKPQLAMKPTVVNIPKKNNDNDAYIYMNQDQLPSSSAKAGASTDQDLPPPKVPLSGNRDNGNTTPENQPVAVTVQQQSTAAETASISSAQSQPTPRLPARKQHRQNTADVEDRLSVATFDTESGDRFHIYQNEDDVYSSFKASEPKLDSVQKYLVERLSSGELRDEFKDLPTGLDGSRDVANLDINYKKNRFASIQPYDSNRVELLDGYTTDGVTDFVNASYISGYNSTKAYIAAQGPRENTVVDFWRMVWQEKITHIVMLTNVIEAAKSKCHEYWPGRKKSQTHGVIKVTGLDVETRANYIIRTFRLKSSATRENREVVQYHYVTWPDHDVPTTTSLIVFWRFVIARSAHRTPSAPLLVHCSAGVGRTGSFIGLDTGFQMAVREGKVDVSELVKRMRNERCWMVQAAEQFVFLHKALLEAYTARDTFFKSVREFATTFSKPISVYSSHPRIDKEFKTLIQMQSSALKTKHDLAEDADNIAKNRVPDVLPPDDHIVELSESVPDRNCYINAVYMSTFWHRRGCIVTQLPLPDTLVDFWRMVYGEHVQTVVSLAARAEDEHVKPYCWYWPRSTGEVIHTGPYTVRFQSKSHIGDRITSYALRLNNQDVTSESRAVRLLRYEDWAEEVPANTSDLLHLVQALENTHSGGNDNTHTGGRPHQPVVIQCSDGVFKCGLFCAICDVIHRVTCDQEIDVYMAVRHLQSIIPQAVTSETQYRYLYDLVQRQAGQMKVY